MMFVRIIRTYNVDEIVHWREKGIEVYIHFLVTYNKFFRSIDKIAYQCVIKLFAFILELNFKTWYIINNVTLKALWIV